MSWFFCLSTGAADEPIFRDDMRQFDQQYFLYQRLRDYDPIPGLDLLLGDPQKASAWHRTETLLKWVNTVSEEALDPAVLIAAPDPAISALGRCAALYGQ